MSVEPFEWTCDGGYACFAVEHVEGCFTGEGEPGAVKGEYFASVRQRIAALETALADASEQLDAAGCQGAASEAHRIATDRVVPS